MKNKKKIFLIGTILIALISGVAYVKFSNNKSQKTLLTTIEVQRGDIQLAILATGIVQPQNRLEIKTPISGRLEEILVSEGQHVKKGEILAWMSSTDRAALLDAARAKGQEEVSHWEEVYKPTPLISPMSGVIIARNMEPGQAVTTQDAPLVMSDRLTVKAQVDETDIAKVRIGQNAEISLDAYPDQKIQSRVDHVAFEAKTVSNVTTYEVDVLPLSVPDFMRSGMTANVTFIIRKKENVLLLPQDAVKQVEDDIRVSIPNPDQSKKSQPRTKSVKTGISDGKRIEIVEGLAEGEKVLVAGMKFEQKGNKKEGTNPLFPTIRRRSSNSSGKK